MSPSPAQLLHRAQGEYLEMPGLSLTLFQAQRLWALDADTCERILGTLVDSGFLKRRPDGAFIRTGINVPRPRPVKAVSIEEAQRTHAAGHSR